MPNTGPDLLPQVAGARRAMPVSRADALLPDAANSLAMALVAASPTPLLLLDQDLAVVAVSTSFCDDFDAAREAVTGYTLATICDGEWSVPQLDALLRATVNGHAAVEGYEFDLKRAGRKSRRVLVAANRLDHFDDAHATVMLAITDVTAARREAREKDDLVREKQVLLQELQHRVANSLQIIASVLMQSARRVRQEEARAHLHDAHNRVMSVATLQRLLATTQVGDVPLRSYFKDLCRSIAASMIADPALLSIKATVDETAVDANTSVSLGLIVTELVINALKHAFPGKDPKGCVTVDFAAHGNGWTLTVADDGVGMPAEPGRPGLGSGIVDALSKQLGADVTIGDAAPGTVVTLTRPDGT